MKFVISFATISLLSFSAMAQDGFFLGGVADGIRQAEEMQLQRRALESGNYGFYNQLRQQQQIQRQQQQLREMEQLIEENNRILSDYERNRRMRGIYD